MPKWNASIVRIALTYWRDARVVEWTALEMRRTGDCTLGSNPSLSATEKGLCRRTQPFFFYVTGLFVIIVASDLDNQNGHNIIIYIIFNNVLTCNMSRPYDIVSSLQRFRMSNTFPWVKGYILYHFDQFLIVPGIRLLPPFSNFLRLWSKDNLVAHKESRYASISLGLLSVTPLPSLYSFRT